MQWSLGGHKACCNLFLNKPFHMLSTVTASRKTLSSEIKCVHGCHYFYFSLQPGKRGLFSQRLPSLARGEGFCASSSSPGSGRCLWRGSPSPHSHAFNH